MSQVEMLRSHLAQNRRKITSSVMVLESITKISRWLRTSLFPKFFSASSAKNLDTTFLSVRSLNQPVLGVVVVTDTHHASLKKIMPNVLTAQATTQPTTKGAPSTKKQLKMPKKLRKPNKHHLHMLPVYNQISNQTQSHSLPVLRNALVNLPHCSKTQLKREKQWMIWLLFQLYHMQPLVILTSKSQITTSS